MALRALESQRNEIDWSIKAEATFGHTVESSDSWTSNVSAALQAAI
jgi:hypothetical protein